MKFEHAYDYCEDGHKMKDALEQRSADGWELVTVATDTTNEVYSSTYEYWWKRPVE